MMARGMSLFSDRALGAAGGFARASQLLLGVLGSLTIVWHWVVGGACCCRRILLGIAERRKPRLFALVGMSRRIGKND
jgi:hypothetical protein